MQDVYKRQAQSHYKVVLKEDTEVLDEVVVVGYGVKQKRSTMTTAISKMDSKVLELSLIHISYQSNRFFLSPFISR